MTDLEITKACAEMMGINVRIWCDGTPQACWIYGDGREYRPLHDGAQAMDMVKRFGLDIEAPRNGVNEDWEVYRHSDICDVSSDPDLNRAICLCCAAIAQGERQ